MVKLSWGDIPYEAVSLLVSTKLHDLYLVHIIYLHNVCFEHKRFFGEANERGKRPKTLVHISRRSLKVSFVRLHREALVESCKCYQNRVRALVRNKKIRRRRTTEERVHDLP